MSSPACLREGPLGSQVARRRLCRPPAAAIMGLELGVAPSTSTPCEGNVTVASAHATLKQSVQGTALRGTASSSKLVCTGACTDEQSSESWQQPVQALHCYNHRSTDSNTLHSFTLALPVGNAWPLQDAAGRNAGQVQLPQVCACDCCLQTSPACTPWTVGWAEGCLGWGQMRLPAGSHADAQTASQRWMS